MNDKREINPVFWPAFRMAFLGGKTWTLLMHEEHYMGDVTVRPGKFPMSPNIYECKARHTRRDPEGLQRICHSEQEAVLWLCSVKLQEMIDDLGLDPMTAVSGSVQDSLAK